MRWIPLLLITTSALAHPMGSDRYSLRTGLQLGPTGLQAVVVGEVPVPAVIQALNARTDGRPSAQVVDAWKVEKLDQLASTATLTLDGAPLAATWAASGSALNGLAIEGFFVYAVEAKVDLDALPKGTHTLVLTTAAWPDDPMVFDAEVRAAAPFAVTASSAPDAWTPDPSARSLTVSWTRSATGPD
jgi:hypothetical protein